MLVRLVVIILAGLKLVVVKLLAVKLATLIVAGLKLVVVKLVDVRFATLILTGLKFVAVRLVQLRFVGLNNSVDRADVITEVTVILVTSRKPVILPLTIFNPSGILTI